MLISKAENNTTHVKRFVPLPSSVGNLYIPSYTIVWPSSGQELHLSLLWSSVVSQKKRKKKMSAILTLLVIGMGINTIAHLCMLSTGNMMSTLIAGGTISSKSKPPTKTLTILPKKLSANSIMDPWNNSRTESSVVMATIIKLFVAWNVVWCTGIPAGWINSNHVGWIWLVVACRESFSTLP